MIYLIGSLRNPKIPEIGNTLRAAGFKVFDDWFAGGPVADDSWRDYEKLAGRTYAEALKGPAARNIYEFDVRHLAASHTAVLIAPGGKSAHLELGVMIGRGKKGYVLFDTEPERWDVMYQFCTGVHFNIVTLMEALKKDADNVVCDVGGCGARNAICNNLYTEWRAEDLN